MELFNQEVFSLGRQNPKKECVNVIEGTLVTSDVLLIVRILSLVLSSVLFMYIALQSGIRWTLYLSNWGVFLVSAHFAALSLSFNSSRAQYVAAAMYELTWCSQWLITLLFWIAIYPVPGYPLFMAVSVHGGMLSLTVFDYSICRHSLKLSNWKSVVLPLCFYLLFLLAVSVTIHPVYDILTFTDVTSYIFLALGLTVALVSLYIGASLGSYKKREASLAEVQMNPIL